MGTYLRLLGMTIIFTFIYGAPAYGQKCPNPTFNHSWFTTCEKAIKISKDWSKCQGVTTGSCGEAHKAAAQCKAFAAGNCTASSSGSNSNSGSATCVEPTFNHSWFTTCEKAIKVSKDWSKCQGVTTGSCGEAHKAAAQCKAYSAGNCTASASSGSSSSDSDGDTSDSGSSFGADSGGGSTPEIDQFCKTSSTSIVKNAVSQADQKVSTVAELNSILKNYTSGRTILIRNGTYNLNGATHTLKSPLRLVGESKCGVVIKNFNRIEIQSGRMLVGNIIFEDSKKGIQINAQKNLDQLDFLDNTFRKTTSGITSGLSSRDANITNLRVGHSRFYNLSGSSARAISLTEAIFLGAEIYNNRVDNMTSTGATLAITVKSAYGSYGYKNQNITVRGNVITNLSTSNFGSNNGELPPVHGIWLFAENVLVEGNTITEIQSGKDHEAMYLKANNATIRNNRIHNGGANSQEGDIIIKSSLGYANYGNVIENNVITSNDPGDYAWGIVAYGGSTIRNNTIIKQFTTRGGIHSRAYGENAVINNNTVIISGGRGIYFDARAKGETTQYGPMTNSSITMKNNTVYTMRNPPLYFEGRANSNRIFDSGGHDYCQGKGCTPIFSKSNWSSGF